MINVQNLTKKYMKTKEFTAVDNINFEISKGEIVALLGNNGAGKSTTIKMLCGIVGQTSGTASIFGLDVSQPKNLKKILRKSSFLLEGQRSIYYYFTLMENIKYFLALKGIAFKENNEYINQLITFFGLKENKHTPVGKFSTGMKQKASIIIALSGDEELIVLDEPTLGLDVQSANNMVTLLKEFVKTRNKTVLITAHNMRVVEDLCERIIIIDEGRIIKDDVISKFKNLFTISQLEITCNNISNNDLQDFDYQENIDGTYTVRMIVSNEPISKAIAQLEEKGAKVLSIKSDNSDFESAYVNFIEEYKGGKAI